MMMVKKKQEDVVVEEEQQEEVKKILSRKDIASVVEESMVSYAEQTILDRAIPHVWDGLKPVQRRILFTMGELHLWSSGKTLKSARIVGEAMGKYHPHGDSSVYGAEVRMAQDFSLREPLVTGQGNFGSIDGDGAAAMRYCVTGDTLIKTSVGDMDIKTIHEKFQAGELSSVLVMGIEREWVSVSQTFDSGVHPTITIETSSGKKLRGTYNHPVLIKHAVKAGQKSHPFKWAELSDVHLQMKVIIDGGEPETIVRKENSTTDRVYSLRVDSETHSFISNGFYSHNTEAKLSEIGDLMLADIDYDTVDFVDNFDGTMKEPSVLPTKIPNLLVNGSSGIAVGMSTSILPHNLNEVCSAVKYLAERWTKREKITVDDLIEIIPGPDLPTGGVIYRFRKNDKEGIITDQIRTAYETGYSPVICQAKADIEVNGKNRVVISEIPYQVSKGTILEGIAKDKDKFIGKITDINDESDQNGMRIVFDVTRGCDPQDALESILTNTKLRTTLSINHLALNVDEDGNVYPEILSLKNMLIAFVNHRLNIIIRRTEYNKAKAEKRLHIVNGLLAALAHIEEVISIIKKSKDTDTAKKNLMKLLSIDELQTQAILDMQLRRLASLEVKKLEDEKKELLARIKELVAILSSEPRRLQIIKDEMDEINGKFVRPRRTVILSNESGNRKTVTLSDLIVPTENQVVTITNKGVVRVPISDVKDKSVLMKPSKADYEFSKTIELMPTDKAIFVTDHGMCQVVESGRIEDTTISGMLPKNDTLVDISKYSEEDYLTTVTKFGNVKRTVLSDIKQSNRFEPFIGLEKDDVVIMAKVSNDKSKVFVVTKGNISKQLDSKGLVFEANSVNPQASSSAKGVSAIKLQSDDEIVFADVFNDDKELLFVTNNGYYKKISTSDFPVQGRSGQGVLTYKNSNTFGDVASMTLCDKKSIVEMISEKMKVRIDTGSLVNHIRSSKPEKITIDGFEMNKVSSINMVYGVGETKKPEKKQKDEKVVSETSPAKEKSVDKTSKKEVVVKSDKKVVKDKVGSKSVNKPTIKTDKNKPSKVADESQKKSKTASKVVPAKSKLTSKDVSVNSKTSSKDVPSKTKTNKGK